MNIRDYRLFRRTMKLFVFIETSRITNLIVWLCVINNSHFLTSTSFSDPDGAAQLSSNLDFSILAKSPTFVDKTLLIKAFFDNNNRSLLITVPSSFGRSSNLIMLKSFLALQTDAVDERQAKTPLVNMNVINNNYRLFRRLKITKLHPELTSNHFGRYPVVYVDFQKSFPTSSRLISDDIIDRYCWTIRQSFREHGYLLQSNRLNKTDLKRFKRWYDYYSTDPTVENENQPPNDSITNDPVTDYPVTNEQVTDGLKLLSSLLYKHFLRKVIILLDAFDDPILEVVLKLTTTNGSSSSSSSSNKSTELRQIVRLSNEMVSGVLTKNQYVERIFITATSYAACSGLFGLENLSRYRFSEVNPFTEFYGFTGQEVDRLLRKFNATYDGLDQTDVREKVDSLFDGYKPFNGYKPVAVDSNTSIYNSACVSDLLKFNTFEAVFWPLTEAFLTVRRLLNVDKFRNDLIALLKDEKISIVSKSSNCSTADIFKLNDIISRPFSGRTDVDIYLNFLLDQGYLTPSAIEDVRTADRTNETYTNSDRPVEVKIPNEMVKEKFISFLAEYYNVNPEILKVLYGFKSKFL